MARAAADSMMGKINFIVLAPRSGRMTGMMRPDADKRPRIRASVQCGRACAALASRLQQWAAHATVATGAVVGQAQLQDFQVVLRRPDDLDAGRQAAGAETRWRGQRGQAA